METKYIETIMKLMGEYVIDEISLEGVTIKKSRHATDEEPAKPATDDDLLFYSVGES